MSEMPELANPAENAEAAMIGYGLNIERTPLVTQVVDRLRELVLSGRLAPGTRLVQEQVASELRVSRTPLREAIRVLVHEGLLTPIASNASVQVVELSNRDARELYEIREFVDGLATRLCASRGLSDEELAELEQLAGRLKAAVEPFDVNSWVATHARFHLAVLAATANARLQQLNLIVSMSAQMLYPRYATSAKRMRASAAEHIHIIEAIRAGDPAKAEAVARAHIQTASRFWLANDSDGSEVDAHAAGGADPNAPGS